MNGRILLLAFVAAVGCAPTYHVPPAYRFDRPRAEDLEKRAEDECRAAVGEERVPKRRFVTDGCTGWPDGWWTGRTWQACCIEHDITYWCGGSSDRRRQADLDLDACVEKAYSGWMGSLMWTGTRALAGRGVPAHWRWGYGHDYPAPE
jgi:hypothetical protein